MSATRRTTKGLRWAGTAGGAAVPLRALTAFLAAFVRRAKTSAAGRAGPPEASGRFPGRVGGLADYAALVLIVLAMLRVASTWTVFSATIDEPMHITAGLELYTQHTYTYQPENPPLPRLVLAFAPWLGGMKFDPALVNYVQLQQVFFTGQKYETNLILARCGNLLFFALASLATWWWGRRELGSAGAFVATLLFTMQPMVVGHAGVATHDMAATAGVAWSLIAFLRWCDGADVRRAIVFGVVVGLAILCKFSCIGYVPAACVAVFVVRRPKRPPLHQIAIAIVASLVVIAAGYAFQVQIFVKGIEGLRAIDQAGGHYGYLFGEISTKGWWWYFPVALALKTTIASLLLALLAIPKRAALHALAAAAAILLVAMPSNLDLGLRYVLPLYVPLSIAGAAAALTFKRRWIPIVLLVWHTGASLAAHPDNFPYFNEPASQRPWEYLIDSNIDWGQDVLRLRDVLREKHVDRVGLAIYGWHEWDDLGFPPHYDAYPTLPAQGWIAVSEHLFQLKRFEWLRGRRYERVGKSIRLYYVP